MHRWFSLDGYGRLITEALEDSERYRGLIHQLPREFHALSHDDQAAALAEPPTLTGERRWDAFLAAVVEHIARHHDHTVPEWVDEPERFLDRPWVIARGRGGSASIPFYTLRRHSSGIACCRIRST